MTALTQQNRMRLTAIKSSIAAARRALLLHDTSGAAFTAKLTSEAFGHGYSRVAASREWLKNAGQNRFVLLRELQDALARLRAFCVETDAPVKLNFRPEQVPAALTFIEKLLEGATT
jgi:hypothetical protein